MGEAVYVLCALTSCTAAGLLLRAYLASRVRLLLWCVLGFTGLALNNILLIVDKLVAPDTDLELLRTTPAFVGVTILALGLVWEGRSS